MPVDEKASAWGGREGGEPRREPDKGQASEQMKISSTAPSTKQLMGRYARGVHESWTRKQASLKQKGKARKSVCVCENNTAILTSRIDGDNCEAVRREGRGR